MRKQIWWIDYKNNVIHRKGVLIFFDEMKEDDYSIYFFRNDILIASLHKMYTKIIEEKER